MEDPRSHNTTSNWNRSGSDQGMGGVDGLEVPVDGSPALRILVSVVYSVVCATGLVGNLLVLVLLRVRSGHRKRSSINLFVLNLAVTDFQFVLTLPFWAADTALDFSWPFGSAMCKVVLTVTVLNSYASVFFLTAMSVTRYRSVASALKDRSRRRLVPVRWVVFGLWLSAAAASLPAAIFSRLKLVAGERLCLLDFPDSDSGLLALFHLQKVLLGFVGPMLIVSACYLLLLRLVRLRSMSQQQVRRRSRSRVTRSVTIVVLSFFLCWMPNHAITLWGVLVKFNLVQWDRTYYVVHTYVHPLTVCLALTNSCLNPVLYCLMRPEFRTKLKDLFRRMCSPRGSGTCRLRPCTGPGRADPDDTQVVIPLNTVETENCRLSVLTEP